MVREDLISGLKNALVRGESIQEAMQTFLAAGYSEQELTEAAHYLNANISTSTNPLVQRQSSTDATTQEPRQTNDTNQANQQTELKPGMSTKKKLLILTLVLIVILLFTALGLAAFGVFGEKIANMVLFKN